jgi:hypothetical protein
MRPVHHLTVTGSPGTIAWVGEKTEMKISSTISLWVARLACKVPRRRGDLLGLPMRIDALSYFLTGKACVCDLVHFSALQPMVDQLY